MENKFLRARVPKLDPINRIANRFERSALAILEKVASCRDMRVSQKLRLADVLPIRNSGLDDDLFNFALTAHFDFTVTFDEKAVIVVEFDGSGHLNAKSIDNDAKKNRLCSYFSLPLMRVDTQYLRRIGNSTILEFVLDETLKRIQIDYERTLPMFSFDSEIVTPFVSEVFLPYDVKQFRLNPKTFLNTMFASKQNCLEHPSFADLKTLSQQGDLSFDTRLAKSADDFYTAAALTKLDDETAILGVGSFFNNPQLPLDGAFLATAFALIDALDLIRMFDESRYGGIRLQHAIEFLEHFHAYASDKGTGRFLSLDPLCKVLTADWLNLPE